MNPFEYAHAMATAWMDGGKGLMRAQEEANRNFTQQAQAAAGKWQATGNELSTSGEQLAEAGRAWSAMWTAAAGMFTSISSGWSGGNETLQATMRHMTDPRAWLAGGGEMDEVLARMAEGPRFADLWDTERRYARVMHTWMQMRRCSFEHSAVVLQAWIRAGQNFMQAVPAGTESRARLAQWIDIANKELLETQRSAKFLETQSAVIRASIDLRVAQQELTEHIGKQYGFPTRSELDDVHRSVTELRREVRALRRAAAHAPEARAPELPSIEESRRSDEARANTARKPARKNLPQPAAAKNEHHAGKVNGRGAATP